MRRLFFSLYLSIAAAIAFVFFGLPLLIERAFEGALLGVISEQYAEGPRLLFEAELADVPMAEWPDHVADLQQEFGYPLELLNLAAIEEREAVLERLRNGEVATPLDSGNEDYVYIPLRGSGYVMKTYFSPRESEHGERTIGGFFYLIEKQVARRPVAERDAYLQELSEQSKVPFAAGPASNFDITDDELTVVLDGGIASRDVDGPGEQYFKRLSGTDNLLVIGPIPDIFINRYGTGIALAILGSIFAVAVFLWLRPLWRDMLALDRGVAALGDGKLDTQVDVSRRSSIHGLATTFNAMAGRIKALIGAQKDLTDSVSHELRTPIARLRFGMERLQRSGNVAEQAKLIDGINDDIDELDKLVDELLSFSRLNSAESPIAQHDVAIEPWIGKVAHIHRPMSQGIEILTSTDPNLKTLDFDPQLMSRAIGNLVRNGIRHARSTVRLVVEATTHGGRLIVEDDGAGIPTEQRGEIFEPFARGPSGETRDSRGYGLGLAIVKRICDSHGAEISVGESALGGAKFAIEIDNSGRANPAKDAGAARGDGATLRQATNRTLGCD